jgi:serine/threonine protein kinase
MGGAAGIPGYEDLVEIGHGRAGVVHRARWTGSDGDVAIKVLTGAQDAASVRRFERGRQSIVGLSGHPAIVAVHETGFTRSDHPYLVMEHMAGGSLGTRVAERGPMPWQDAVGVGVRIGQALEAAHRAGMSHGDVTPDNILVSASGETKLSDVGIAAVLGGSPTHTATDPAGIAHAPPEVLDGAAPGPAADVYGLASTVYALIYGAAPFWSAADSSVLPIMTRIFWKPVPDLRPLGVPEPVCTVLEWALAKRAADRPPSVQAFVDALTEAAGAAGETAFAGAVVVEALPVPLVAGHDEPPTRRRRPPKAVAAAAVAVLVALAVGALALVPGGWDGDDDQARGALVTLPPDDDDGGGSSTTVSAAPPITAASPAPARAPEPRTPPSSSSSSVPRGDIPPAVPIPRTVTTAAPVPVPVLPPVPAPPRVPAPIPTISITGPDSLVVGQTAAAFSCTVRNATSWVWIDADGNRFAENQPTVYVDATTPGVTTITVYAANADGAARSVTKSYTVIPR